MNAFSRTQARSARGPSRPRRFLRCGLILPLLVLALGCTQQQTPDLEATIVAQSTVLAKLAETPTPTNTPLATSTPLPTATPTPEPEPTATPVPPPTNTPVPRPRATDTPAPTATPAVDPALRAAMLTFRTRLGEIHVADGQVAAQYNDWLGTLGGKPPAQIDAEFGWYRNQAEALFSQLQSVVAPAPMANVKSSYLSGLNAMMESMVLFQRGIRERNETLLNQADAKIAIRNQFVRQALSEFNKIAERYQLGVPCFRWEGACA
ncbi:MAG TPA: hypothetical protein VI789_07355 [Dehalococcoidia bacterium]|nr:hypothetical protein [Dehalococcoidia bacterium]